MARNGKIHDIATLTAKLAELRQARKVVHCHGVFDLLHVGHIRHLNQAKQLGDVLVVTITPDRYVNKGPDRPAFGEQLRAEALAALDCVDYVAINDQPDAIETIRRVRPHLFVKGSEFKELKDHSGAVRQEAEAVASVGGQIAFTDDITFSSSHLINRYLSSLDEPVRDYLDALARRHSAESILGYLQAVDAKRVLVVGEAIVDEYHYCDAIGKSSKEPMLAVKQQSIETFNGGILAVANHMAGFVDHVDVVSTVGADCPRESFIRSHLSANVAATFIHRAAAPTIVKRRFIDRYFFQKLFEVYEMNDQPVAGKEQQQLIDAVDAAIGQADLVVVVDFGHGVLTGPLTTRLAEQAEFLAVNTQSNAGNLGYHTISKYPRADLICITEGELRLEARDRDGDLRPLVMAVADKLHARQVLITRGAHGCLAYSRDEGFADVPALAGQVRDRMGAGDTFLAVSSLCALAGAPIEIVGLVGNAAGAQAVATVGHRQPLQKHALFKHIECLLK